MNKKDQKKNKIFNIPYVKKKNSDIYYNYNDMFLEIFVNARVFQ